MNVFNLDLIEQPHWKVRVIDFVASFIGILVHVEGIPVGRRPLGYLIGQTTDVGNSIGGGRHD